MKLSTRLILVMSGMAIMIIAISMGILYYFILPKQMENIKDKTRETAVYLQKAASFLNVAEQQNLITELFAQSSDLAYILILNQEGRALAHSDPDRIGMLFTDEGTLAAARQGKSVEQIYVRDEENPHSPFCGQQVVDILVPLYDQQGSHIGAVNVGFSLQALQKAKRQFYYILEVSALVILFIIVLTVVWSYHSIIIPVKNLRVAVGEVRNGNYNPVCTINRHDELGFLAQEFNHMSAQIANLLADLHNREAELEKVREELEMRVNIRTQELRVANRALELQMAEKERIEEELRESKNNLKKQVDYLNMLIYNLNEAFYTYTVEGKITFVNRKITEVLGYSPEEFVGHHLLDFTVPECRKKTAAIIEKRLKEGVANSLEIPVIHKDGSRRYVRINGCPIVENGKIVGGMSLVEDITDFRKAEEALRISEEKYAKAFRLSPLAITITHLETGTHVEVNETWKKYMEYTEDEVIGRTTEELNMYADPRERDEVRKILLGGNPIINREIRFRNKSGKILQTLCSIDTITIDDEKYLLFIATDVSEHKAIKEALAAEKEQLAVTLKSIGEGVITTDLSGHVVLSNEAAQKLLGYKYEDIKGENISDVLQISDLIIPDIEKGLFIDNHTIRRKDGSQRIINAGGAPIFDSLDRLRGIVWVLRDITDQQRLEEELIKASKLESLAVLAGGLAHDFNNLLTVIIGNATLAKALAGENPEITEFLQEINKASFQARSLTQQLLTFAKGGAPVKRTVSIKDLLENTVNFALSGSNVKCNYLIDSDIWNVKVDEGQISQVLNNLIINAIQAMPEGGEITVIAENVYVENEKMMVLKEGRYVRLSIKDEGEGIPEEHKDKVFDPYYTTKKSGNGLGLATSYSIIKKHGGHIYFDSKLHQGTTFYMYLPVSDAGECRITAVENERLTGQGSILIMDDEESILKVLSQMLISLGYEVQTACNGEECIRIYENALVRGQGFKAVILDLTVPGSMGGKKVLQKLLNLDPGVRIILSSGYHNDPIMEEYEKWGVKGVISKPYGVEELSIVVQKAIDS